MTKPVGATGTAEMAGDVVVPDPAAVDIDAAAPIAPPFDAASALPFALAAVVVVVGGGVAVRGVCPGGKCTARAMAPKSKWHP